MTKLKHFALALLFLGLTSCGCGDSGGGGGSPQAQPAEFRMSSEIPCCPVPIPTIDDPVCEIDVFFLLDDSTFMNVLGGMGLIPNEPTDNRGRQIVAQRVFDDLRARLKADVEAKAQALIGTGDLPANIQFDFAFGVGRYEDYGATAVEYVNLAGVIDSRAAPFMLNMPLLRELHPNFGTAFAAALNDKQTLSDGNVTLAATQQLRQDPQSAMEALYQIATGAGFDGNADQDTTDNGGPCSLLAQVLQGAVFPPVVPGIPPDVPAVTYGDGGSDPQDPARPVFTVLDENSVQADSDCIASGNVGGAGWREGSLRWVLLASDIASIGVFPQEPTVGQAVDGKDGEFVLAEAFSGVTGRFGAAGGVNSPANAATVQETFDALIAQGIEIMCLGAPGVLPGQTKPNLPSDTVPNGIPAVENPEDPAFGPYTWMSAASILTGSKISDDTNQFARLFPAVFNLGNVGLLDDPNIDPILGPPTFATAPTDDVLGGLTERILDRAQDKEFVVGEGGTFPPLPTLLIRFPLTMDESAPNFLFTRTAGPLLQTVSVVVPTYYSDGQGTDFTVDAQGNPIPGVPSPVIVNWTQDYEYSLADPQTNPPTQVDTMPFAFDVILQSVENQVPGENDDQVDFLREKFGFSTPQVQFPPGIKLTDGSGTLQLTAWTDDAPGQPRGVLMVNGSYQGWRDVLQDLTWGAFFAPEAYGINQPFPTP